MEVRTMSTYFLIRRMILVASLALGVAQIAWFAALPIQAADRPSAAPSQSLSMGGTDTASGAVEDTLKACVTRIPKDASIGQRMIAEESCGRDEGDRKSIQSVPGAYAVQDRR
jgi:hypothetical protein